MKFLVPGLCLSRNLGGPAMALTLVQEVKKKLPEAEFMFAINPAFYEEEKRWADYYGAKIVRGDDVLTYALNTHPILRGVARVGRWVGRRIPSPREVRSYEEIHEELMQAYRVSDAIISMRGISYVGDGTRGIREGPISYSDFYYAKKNKKPFTHFVQSFGPFDDWKVRYFARKDFNGVDFVPARGRESAQCCREIIRHPEKVFDFPDIALLLPAADEGWTRRYLDQHQLEDRHYILLSPSSVIYHLPGSLGGSTGTEHARAFYLMAKEMLSQGERLLFLPHMVSRDKSQCDREICLKVLAFLEKDRQDVSGCHVVEEDLDVWQAKALIAKSKLAVVSRYHAAVAAVSTGTPVIGIGWNMKYEDLLDYYGIRSMAIDAREESAEGIAAWVAQKKKEVEQGELSVRIRERHEENVKRVESAFELLDEWIKSKVKG